MTQQGRMSERRNELLTDMASLTENLLREHDVPAADAVVIASALVDRLADHWGGQNITFPKDFRWKLANMELEIYSYYDGTNLGETALKFGITERGLRKLIARARKRLVSRSQVGLFDSQDA